jgi:magnesium transporter
MLINCVAYQNGRKLADLPVAEISDYVARDDTFVWVAMRDASPPEIAEMQHEFGLHELAVEDAQRGHQRPKIEEYGDSLFVVVKTVEMDKDNDELVLGEIDIFVGANYVLSSRQNSSHGFLGVRSRAEREPHLLRHGSGFVLYALMDAVVDRYFPLVDALESELEQIEDRIFTGDSQRDNIERLYDLKRKVMTLRHAVAPLLDAIRDTISTAIQVNLSMIALDEGEVNKRLAAWAAIFGVLTAFAGIWGMNFEFMPELKWKYGYPVALAAMFSVCFYLYRRFRRARWL